MRLSLLILVLVPVAIGLAGLYASEGSRDLSEAHGSMFTASGNCATCHTPDASDPAALRSSTGADVSPPSYWRSTMMANSSRDPFWRAKVSAEVAANPTLQVAIEDKCTTCHAPMARTEAIASGAAGYTLERAMSEPMALDGVSCTVCHQIQPGNLGGDESFSGGFEVDDSQTVFGPYERPAGRVMLALTGYNPVYGEHVGRSELCATCHTLFTESVDESGQVVGRLPEQTPYLEWLNSSFRERGTQCQDCHMPVESSPVPISNNPRGLEARAPFYRHEFVGGNAFMLTMLRDNGDSLGVTAEPAHFDSTIARTRRVLGAAAGLAADAVWHGDTLAVAVTVTNHSGHKLPTGYPSRRVWLDLEVRDGAGVPVFRSGAVDRQTGEIAGLDSDFEPHHLVIRSEGQVQVYQSVMGDAAGRPTFGLMRAAGYLKDNRIPPEGWLAEGPRSEDTRPSGRALDDPDFNRAGAAEGAGSDRVEYRLGLERDDYRVIVRLRYQSIAPRFAADLFRYDTEEVASFRAMYDRADLWPELIDSLSLDVASSLNHESAELPRSVPGLEVYPNPVRDRLVVRTDGRRVLIHDVQGRLVAEVEPGNAWRLRDTADRPVAPGVYFVTALDSREVVSTRPVVVVR